nr:hypothetical protein [uncultured Carboxylicivirga sp.]
MEDFVNSFDKIFGDNYLRMIISMLFSILVLVLAPRFFRLMFKELSFYKKEQGLSTDKLFKLLNTNFERELIKSKEDITVLLNSVSREYYKDFSLAPIIEDYIAHLSEKDDKGILEKNYELLKEIIRKENEEKPFSNLPNEERRLLMAIDDSVKHNDINSIKFNLNELNAVISTRTKIYNKLIRTNRWSVPIAVIGIILTILFGILSVRPSIDYDKIKNINKEIVNSKSD